LNNDSAGKKARKPGGDMTMYNPQGVVVKIVEMVVILAITAA
jgi:hypothetical protein